jgi:hypothetical protein
MFNERDKEEMEKEDIQKKKENNKPKSVEITKKPFESDFCDVNQMKLQILKTRAEVALNLSKFLLEEKNLLFV